MKQVNRRLSSVLLVAVVVAAIATPAMAAKSGTVKGTIVKADPAASVLVVKDEKAGTEVTMATNPRTSVAGLDRGGMLSAEALKGLEGTYVTVKWSEGDSGPVAQLVRVYPNKQG